MSDGYIKGLITGILAAMGITLLSVLIYFAFFYEMLKDNDSFPSYRDENMTDEYRQFLEKEETIMGVIRSRFYEKVDDETMYRGAYDGIMASLNDPYSCYYSQSEFESINQTTDGEYVGIGCYVSQNKDTKEIVVLSVIEGSPSEEAGMMSEDIILAVDGEDMVGYDLDQAVAFIKGKVGTSVVVKVKRGTEVLELSMVRRRIEQKTVDYKMLEDNVGYIRTASFYKVTLKEFKEAMKSLEAQGMEKLIIDLRDNPGGLFDITIEMLDIFLGSDMLAAYIEDSSGNQEKSYTIDDDEFSKPIVIMINEHSASASELFTQTMRDYGKATVLGTKSFGKGIYQNLYQVGNDGSAVKITGGRYFSPKGVCVHGVGIEPDIVIEPEKNGESGTSDKEEDNQIRAALDFLKNK